MASIADTVETEQVETVSETCSEKIERKGTNSSENKKSRFDETAKEKEIEYRNNVPFVRQESKLLECAVHNSITHTRSQFLRQNSDYKDNNLKEQFSRQKSNISATEQLYSKDAHVCDTVLNNILNEADEANLLNKENHKLQEKCTVYYKSEESKVFIEDAEKENSVEKLYFKSEKRQRCRCCMCSIIVMSCLMSMVAFVVVVRHLTDKPKLDFDGDVVYSNKAAATSSLRDSGSFKLDQNYLKDTGKIQWSVDENSYIQPYGDGGCLRVPFGGKYLIVSRFTFVVSPGTSTGNIFHFFKLLDSKGELKVGGYKRIIVSIDDQERVSRDTQNVVANRKEPSVFIEFIELEDREQICANVSRPDLLYISSLDNDINIIRV